VRIAGCALTAPAKCSNVSAHPLGKALWYCFADSALRFFPNTIHIGSNFDLASPSHSKMGFAPFFLVPQAKCPLCLGQFDERLAEALCDENTQHPRPGDLTVCPVCASMLLLTQDLQPRVTTRAEVSEQPPEVQYELHIEQAKRFGRKALARAASVGRN
jgi:hypothetical protein